MIELFHNVRPISERARRFMAPALSVSESETRLGGTYIWRQALTSIPLIVSDVMAFVLVAALVFVVSFSQVVTLTLPAWALALYLVATGLGSCTIFGLYPNLGHHPAVELKRLFVPLTTLSFCLLVSVQLSKGVLPQLVGIGLLWLLLILLVPMTRGLVRKTAARYFSWWQQPIVILGGGPMGEAIYRSLLADPACGFRPIGIVDDAQEQWTHEDVRPEWYIGTYPELRTIVEENKVFWAVVTDCQATDDAQADPDHADVAPVELPHRLYLAETADFVPTMWDHVVTINLVTYFKQTDRLMLPIPRMIKRCMDVVLCLLASVVLLPLILLITLLVRATSRGSVFFRSKRIGRGNRLFKMLKFRSMYTDSELLLEQQLNDCSVTRREWQQQQKLRNDLRVTPLGGFLRRTSLDELPQLFDVMTGKMSLVGPRPMLVSEPDLYGEHFLLYCRMRPGITGLWQVSGRNNTTHDRRVQLVAYYVQNWSPWLDLCILCKTFKVVLTREGAH